jgi:hypothetical protein
VYQELFMLFFWQRMFAKMMEPEERQTTASEGRESFKKLVKSLFFFL